jgi:hypothetical protein
MTPYRNIINNYTELASGEGNIADGTLLQVVGKGSICIYYFLQVIHTGG